MKKLNEISNLFIEDVNNDQGNMMTLIEGFLKFMFKAFLLIGLPVMGYCLFTLLL